MKGDCLSIIPNQRLLVFYHQAAKDNQFPKLSEMYIAKIFVLAFEISNLIQDIRKYITNLFRK